MATNAPSSLWSDLRRQPGDPRPPAPLVLGLVFACELGLVGVVDVLGLPSAAAGTAVVVLAVVASWLLTIPAAMWLAGISFLVINGVVEDRLGQLSWQGVSDLYLLLGVALGCALSAELRRDLGAREVRPRRGHGINKA
jgi:hypothetical protein